MTQLHDRTLRKLHTVANLRNCEARRGHLVRSYVGWSELRNRLSRLLRLGHFCVLAREFHVRYASTSRVNEGRISPGIGPRHLLIEETTT